LLRYYLNPRRADMNTNLKLKIYNKLLEVRPTILVDILKSIIPFKRFVVSTSAGLFWIDPLSHLGNNLLNYGIYEAKTIDIITSRLKEGDIFIDVGANEGFFTILGGRIVGEKGKVLSIEPQNRLINVIKENININKLSNVDVVNVACSDGTKVKSIIYLCPSTVTGSSSMVRKYIIPRKQEVICNTLDNIALKYKIKNIDLIKIDVEGYEYEVLLGAKNLLKTKSITNLLIDFHKSILDTRSINYYDIHNYIISHDYCLDGDKVNVNGYNIYIPK
jgi:FkbM family methyltransferase